MIDLEAQALIGHLVSFSCISRVQPYIFAGRFGKYDLANARTCNYGNFGGLLEYMSD